MTGKTTHLILLGAIAGVILGGLLGYLWPSTLIMGVLRGAALSLLVVATTTVISSVRTGKSMTAAAALPLIYFLGVTIVTFAIGSVASGLLAPAHDITASPMGMSLFLMVATALLFGGILTSMGSFTLVEIMSAATERRPQHADSRERYRRPDRGRPEHGGANVNRPERKDFRGEESRGRDNRPPRERQHGDRDRDRTGQRRERPPFERRNEPTQRSPFAVSPSSSPVYDAEMAEAKPEMKPADREPRSDHRPEGPRRDGHRSGGHRDRGPRQNRDRRGPSGGDYRPRVGPPDRTEQEQSHSAIPVNETIAQGRGAQSENGHQSDEIVTSGNLNSSPFSPKSESTPTSENRAERDEAQPEKGSSDAAESKPESVTYGRSRGPRNDDRPRQETAPTDPSSETVSQVADSYSTDGISFGRSRRRRTR